MNTFLKRPFRLAKIDTEEQLDKLQYPLIAMYKYDGIRCLLHDGKVMSRTLKQIPNRHIREQLINVAHYVGRGWMDGELILKTTQDYNKVQSAVMSVEPAAFDFTYVVFDRVFSNCSGQNYSLRLHEVIHFFHIFPYDSSVMRPALYRKVHSKEDVLYFETMAIIDGYEGIVLRSLTAPYKQGKSTFKEGYGFKFKRTDDAEAVILDCIELQHNLNDPDVNELGLTKRSSHQALKVGSGMLGSFRVKGINGKYKDKVFDVSCGTMTQEQRRVEWEYTANGVGNEYHKGLIITYTFAKHRGTEESPVETRFKSFRED